MLKSKTNTLTNHKRSKQRDEPIRIPLAITGDLLKAREKSRAQGAIDCGFAKLRELLVNQ